MVFPASASYEDELCPVPEEIFSEVAGGTPPNAVEVANALPEAQRAHLAVFCYRKRHLHELGLMIASTCSCNALMEVAGVGGRIIFEQSREPEATLSKERQSQSRLGPKPVTLATSVED